jgi:hypothetical protein
MPDDAPWSPSLKAWADGEFAKLAVAMKAGAQAIMDEANDAAARDAICRGAHDA